MWLNLNFEGLFKKVSLFSVVRWVSFTFFSLLIGTLKPEPMLKQPVGSDEHIEATIHAAQRAAEAAAPVSVLPPPVFAPIPQITNKFLADSEQLWETAPAVISKVSGREDFFNSLARGKAFLIAVAKELDITLPRETSSSKLLQEFFAHKTALIDSILSERAIIAIDVAFYRGATEKVDKSFRDCARALTFFNDTLPEQESTLELKKILTLQLFLYETSIAQNFFSGIPLLFVELEEVFRKIRLLLLSTALQSGTLPGSIKKKIDRLAFCTAFDGFAEYLEKLTDILDNDILEEKEALTADNASMFGNFIQKLQACCQFARNWGAWGYLCVDGWLSESLRGLYKEAASLQKKVALGQMLLPESLAASLLVWFDNFAFKNVAAERLLAMEAKDKRQALLENLADNVVKDMQITTPGKVLPPPLVKEAVSTTVVADIDSNQNNNSPVVTTPYLLPEVALATENVAQVSVSAAQVPVVSAEEGPALQDISNLDDLSDDDMLFDDLDLEGNGVLDEVVSPEVSAPAVVSSSVNNVNNVPVLEHLGIPSVADVAIVGDAENVDVLNDSEIVGNSDFEIASNSDDLGDVDILDDQEIPDDFGMEGDFGLSENEDISEPFAVATQSTTNTPNLLTSNFHVQSIPRISTVKRVAVSVVLPAETPSADAVSEPLLNDDASESLNTAGDAFLDNYDEQDNFRTDDKAQSSDELAFAEDDSELVENIYVNESAAQKVGSSTVSKAPVSSAVSPAVSLQAQVPKPLNEQAVHAELALPNAVVANVVPNVISETVSKVGTDGMVLTDDDVGISDEVIDDSVETPPLEASMTPLSLPQQASLDEIAAPVVTISTVKPISTTMLPAELPVVAKNSDVTVNDVSGTVSKVDIVPVVPEITTQDSLSNLKLTTADISPTVLPDNDTQVPPLSVASVVPVAGVLPVVSVAVPPAPTVSEGSSVSTKKMEGGPVGTKVGGFLGKIKAKAKSTVNKVKAKFKKDGEVDDSVQQAALAVVASDVTVDVTAVAEKSEGDGDKALGNDTSLGSVGIVNSTPVADVKLISDVDSKKMPLVENRLVVVPGASLVISEKKSLEVAGTDNVDKKDSKNEDVKKDGGGTMPDNNNVMNAKASQMQQPLLGESQSVKIVEDVNTKLGFVTSDNKQQDSAAKASDAAKTPPVEQEVSRGAANKLGDRVKGFLEKISTKDSKPGVASETISQSVGVDAGKNQPDKIKSASDQVAVGVGNKLEPIKAQSDSIKAAVDTESKQQAAIDVKKVQDTKDSKQLLNTQLQSNIDEVGTSSVGAGSGLTDKDARKSAVKKAEEKVKGFFGKLSAKIHDKTKDGDNKEVNVSDKPSSA